jgi:uncharacterized membrane protein YphA (DoxX/SURF4 family)
MRWLFFPPFLMLALFLPAAIAYRYVDPASRPPFLVLGIRWFLGILFVVSGLAKLIPHFPNTMGPTNLEFTLAPHGLALFARFIAVAETATGLLLLTRRFATLGALLLVPMLTSILVITTSLHWKGTPYLVAGFLALALGLLAYDYPKLAVLIGDRPPASPTRVRQLLPAAIWAGGLSLVAIGLGTVRMPSNTSPGVWLALAALTILIVLDWRAAARSAND